MKKRVTKSVAKGMKAALDVVLQTEANTASYLSDGLLVKTGLLLSCQCFSTKLQ